MTPSAPSWTARSFSSTVPVPEEAIRENILAIVHDGDLSPEPIQKKTRPPVFVRQRVVAGKNKVHPVFR